jgi:hypothetical protein
MDRSHVPHHGNPRGSAAGIAACGRGVDVSAGRMVPGGRGSGTSVSWIPARGGVRALRSAGWSLASGVRVLRPTGLSLTDEVRSLQPSGWSLRPAGLPLASGVRVFRATGCRSRPRFVASASRMPADGEGWTLQPTGCPLTPKVGSFGRPDDPFAATFGRVRRPDGRSRRGAAAFRPASAGFAGNPLPSAARNSLRQTVRHLPTGEWFLGKNSTVFRPVDAPSSEHPPPSAPNRCSPGGSS